MSHNVVEFLKGLEIQLNNPVTELTATHLKMMQSFEEGSSSYSRLSGYQHPSKSDVTCVHRAFHQTLAQRRPWRLASI